MGGVAVRGQHGAARQARDRRLVAEVTRGGGRRLADVVEARWHGGGDDPLRAARDGEDDERLSDAGGVVARKRHALAVGRNETLIYQGALRDDVESPLLDVGDLVLLLADADLYDRLVAPICL